MLFAKRIPISKKIFVKFFFFFFPASKAMEPPNTIESFAETIKRQDSGIEHVQLVFLRSLDRSRESVPQGGGMRLFLFKKDKIERLRKKHPGVWRRTTFILCKLYPTYAAPACIICLDEGIGWVSLKNTTISLF